MKTLLISTAFALVLPGLAAAHEIIAGDLEIIHPMAFETSATAKAGGGYVTIANNGDTPDALIGIRADFPKVDIHESFEQDGVHRMQHVDRIEIPAGETIELAPGGYHVMFMGLSAPFEAGAEFPATLIFEKAGAVDVTFKIEERNGEQDHSGH